MDDFMRDHMNCGQCQLKGTDKCPYKDMDDIEFDFCDAAE